MLLNNEFYHYSFLYGTSDAHPFTFRVRLRMTDPVSGEALNAAVPAAMARYPYFSIKVEAAGTELDTVFNDAPVPVHEGSTPPCLGTEAANGHFIAVSYQNNDIYIDVHHGLTDGTGLERFAKTLVYHYVSLRYGVEPDPTGILTADQPISEKEAGDPFSYAPLKPTAPIYTYKPEQAFDLAGKNKDTSGLNTTFYLKLREQNVMNFCKKHDGSPSAIISALLYKAILKNHPEAEEPIVAGIAYSLRDAYNVPESHGNLAGLVHVKYPRKAKSYSYTELGTMTRSIILLQSQPENTLCADAGKQYITQYLKSLPDHATRTETYTGFMRRAIGMDTFNLSYIGRQDWSAFAEYVDGYYTIVPLMTSPLSVELNAVNGWFNMTVSQSFSSDRYIRSFMELLTQCGIPYSYEGFQPLTVSNVKVS